MSNPHIGSSFDDFLREDGSLETTTAVATKQVNDWQSSSMVSKAPWRIKALNVLPEYRLAVTFQDGTAGICDLSALKTATNLGIYAPLADPNVFSQARLELGTVTWPNCASLDPALMYEEIKVAKTWLINF